MGFQVSRGHREFSESDTVGNGLYGRGTQRQFDRCRILDLLVEQERSVGEIVDHLDLTQPSVSKHLRVLREAGMVSARVDGQRRIYGIRVDPLMELDEWLEPYRARWRRSLDELEQHLETMSNDPKEGDS